MNAGGFSTHELRRNRKRMVTNPLRWKMVHEIFLAGLVIFLMLSPEFAWCKQLYSSIRAEVGGPRPSSSSQDDLVTTLPGQESVRFKHYAGYVTVEPEKGRALFYWFYEAETQPQQKPLVLWLNGGPGCSSVGYGATQEIGPFLVDVDGKDIKLNPHSWNKEANVLFVESPVGVGFSYTNTSSDYNGMGNTFAVVDMYYFMNNWFRKFPEYSQRPFYIAGESYAGRYVPELAEVLFDLKNVSKMPINLRGILLGNPETSDAEDWNGWVDYAWSHAIISDENTKVIKTYCNFRDNKTWEVQACSEAVDIALKQYSEIDMYSLYTPKCNATRGNNSTQFVVKKETTMIPRMMGGFDPCLDNYAAVFYNRPEVQSALHVSDGKLLRNWSICNDSIFDNWKEERQTVLPIYRKLIAGGIRIWVYSGDTDGRVPVLGTRYNIQALKLPIKTLWKPWYYDGKVAGWFQEYEGVTFATVRGAGHAVPSFKPGESLTLFASFLRGESLPITRHP